MNHPPRATPEHACAISVLLAIGSDGAENKPWWQSLWSRLGEAGFGAGKPHTCTAQDLVHTRDAVAKLAGVDLVILAPSADTGSTVLLQAAAILSEHSTPGLVVLPDELRLCTPRLIAAGLQVVPVGSDISMCVGLIVGLASRQGVVRKLESDLKLAWRAQEHAGTLIQRVDEELRLAARVQQQMLPPEMPKLNGVSFASIFRPAIYVSGDIYRVQQLTEGSVGFMVADVMGHGVKAAMHSILVAHALRMQDQLGKETRIVPPIEALRRLNATMLRQRTDESSFATAVCGVIDTLSGRVRLGVAGHPTPVRTDGQQRFMPVDASGPMLGVFDDAEFSESQFTLERGQTLLLYTDGLEQAMRPSMGALAKSPNLQDEVVKKAIGIMGPHDPRLDASLSRLSHDLDRQLGSLHNGDDVTVLAIRRD